MKTSLLGFCVVALIASGASAFGLDAELDRTYFAPTDARPVFVSDQQLLLRNSESWARINLDTHALNAIRNAHPFVLRSQYSAETGKVYGYDNSFHAWDPETETVSGEWILPAMHGPGGYGMLGDRVIALTARSVLETTSVRLTVLNGNTLTEIRSFPAPGADFLRNPVAVPGSADVILTSASRKSLIRFNTDTGTSTTLSFAPAFGEISDVAVSDDLMVAAIGITVTTVTPIFVAPFLPPTSGHVQNEHHLAVQNIVTNEIYAEEEFVTSQTISGNLIGPVGPQPYPPMFPYQLSAGAHYAYRDGIAMGELNEDALLLRAIPEGDDVHLEPETKSDQYRYVGFSPSEQRIYVHGTVFSLPQGAVLHDVAEDPWQPLQISADGSEFFATRRNSEIARFDAETGERLETRTLPGTYKGISLSADGQRVAAVSGHALYVADGPTSYSTQFPFQPDSALMSLDGKYVAAKSYDVVRIFDADRFLEGDDTPLGLIYPEGSTCTIVFSADSSRFYFAKGDGMVSAYTLPAVTRIARRDFENSEGRPVLQPQPQVALGAIPMVLVPGTSSTPLTFLLLDDTTLATRVEVTNQYATYQLDALTLSRDGSLLAVRDADDSTAFYNALSGDLLGKTNTIASYSVSDVKMWLSASGEFLFTSNQYAPMERWRLQTTMPSLIDALLGEAPGDLGMDVNGDGALDAADTQ